MDLPGNIRLLGGRNANKGHVARGVLEQEIGVLCVMTSDLFLLPTTGKQNCVNMHTMIN